MYVCLYVCMSPDKLAGVPMNRFRSNFTQLWGMRQHRSDSILGNLPIKLCFLEAHSWHSYWYSMQLSQQEKSIFQPSSKYWLLGLKLILISICYSNSTIVLQHKYLLPGYIDFHSFLCFLLKYIHFLIIKYTSFQYIS